MREKSKPRIFPTSYAKVALAILLSMQLALMSISILPEKAFADTATSHKITANVSKMNRYTNGVLDDQYYESVLGVNNALAFCVNPYKLFKAGTVTSTNILSLMNQQTLTYCALLIHYMLNIYDGANMQYNARVLMAQCLIWQKMYPERYYEVWSAEEGGPFPELTKQVRDSALASARQFVNANAWKYEGYGTLWQNGTTQDVATFGVRSIVGRMDLLKASSVPAISDSNESYSLANARYGVYRDAGCTSLAATLITNEDGYAISDELVRGTYYVKELEAPKGYALDPNVHTVAIAAGTTTRVDGARVYDHPLSASLFLQISKYDGERNWKAANEPLGAASLGNALYQVDYYKGQFSNAGEAESSGPAFRTWTFATDETGKCDLSKAEPVEGDPLFVAGSGSNVYPIGTYVIHEICPPTGYLLSSSKYVANVTQDGNSLNVSGDVRVDDGHACICDAEQVKRSDLKFNKVRESDMKRLAGIPFALSSETTGESHIVVTDGNGCVDTSASWYPHSANTNASDLALRDNGAIDESLLDGESGIWFKGTTEDGTCAPNDKVGALPFDTYSLEELPCSKNENLSLVKLSGISIERDGAVIDFGTIVDSPKQSVSISTVARSNDGGKSAAAVRDGNIIDRVSYSGAIIGEEYELKGTLFDKTEKAPVFDEGGNPVQSSLRFTPNNASGYAELTFNFDARNLAGHEIVVFEELFKDGMVVASHEDIDDYDQTIRISSPSIATSAKDASDGDKDVTASRQSRVVDTVSYANLQPGCEYELRGKIAGKETGDVLCSASASFVPKASSGQVDVEFEADLSGMVGQELVLFESLYLDDQLVAAHEDIDDLSQTVNVVQMEISTLALDFADGDKVIMADTEAVITDMVTYQNAIAGKAYKVSGKLMDADAQKPITASGDDGEWEVEAFAEFVAESSAGQVELKYAFDARGLEGKRVTSFVCVSSETDQIDEVVCEESDFANEDQTVEFVTSNIKSYATDATDGDKLLLNSMSAVVTDKISYTNLIPGKEYMLVGKLIDKNTQDVLYVKDKPITTTTTFTPNNPTGTVDVRFEFDASEIGERELVVFEYLYRDMQIGEDDSKSVLVATHEDIDDPKETVAFSKNPKRPTPVGSLAKAGDDHMPLLLLIGGTCVVFAIVSAIAWRKDRLLRLREIWSRR